ncbi:uncharacterized protein FOMMEDRAFT_158307 [Fomitiporia mediterranea MF3/22]|uniref:uncharacterized protein n=1 Tax=Fomitiporia mediterranea (strain MF3/22) TaxID=694068 RepID=UPI0004408949|nr:uncharacterized protein FOMMEDRAFT_158307 [Fomitiporia mediterranea MF3/22]EJD01174.1 hypothetical protein FOMMEDRAFT_158307 [Fomitiporia mediterranea MF3/22]
MTTGTISSLTEISGADFRQRRWERKWSECTYNRGPCVPLEKFVCLDIESVRIKLYFASEHGLPKPRRDPPLRHSNRTICGPTSNHQVSSPTRSVPNGPQYDSSFLSPPLNSFRAPRNARSARPSESQSSAGEEDSSKADSDESVPEASEDEHEDDPQFQRPSYTKSFHPFTYSPAPSIIQAHSHSQGGLRRPAPPLFRPKTFWRHTRRSALTGPSYSPSSYIVRRSTFIAAGLSLDTPHADLSALGVELRIGTISLVPSTALPI